MADKTKTELCDLMKHHGVTEVTLHYSGSGDEGSMKDVSYAPENSTIAAIDSDALDAEWDAFHLRVLEASNWDGYWDGDGGHGDITLDVATGKVTIQHSYVTTEAADEEESEAE